MTAAIEFPADLHLRQLEPSDRRRILGVVDAWWGRPITELLPRPLFDHFRDTSFVLEQNGEVVGFLVGFLSQSYADEAYIHAVGVAPAQRGRGLGRILYERFCAVVLSRGRRRVRAITAPANKDSIAFHRRLGFTVEDEAGDRVRFVRELLPRSPTGVSGDVRAASRALHVPMVGALVALEPLATRHEEELWQAAQAGEVWTWMPADAGSSREAFRRWLDWMLANAVAEPASS